jgi:DNA-directed RNA polymerase subunit alpha
LNISVRPINRLIAKGYETVKDIVELTEDEIVSIKDLGKKSIVEVAVELESLGITNTNWSRFIPNKKEDK